MTRTWIAVAALLGTIGCARVEDLSDDAGVDIYVPHEDGTVEVLEDAGEAETPVEADDTDDAVPDEPTDETPTDTDARDDADSADDARDDADAAEDSPPDVPAVCGDGTVAGTEECDDGNTTALDGCSATCTAEYCGDHLVGTVLYRVDNFETGALTTLPWVPGSPYGFAPSTAHVHGGTYALGPQNVGLTSTTASISLDVFTDGHVCFWYAGESESCCDYFYFSVDGTNVLSTSGAHTTWTEYCTDVTAGTHAFAWTYSKDSSISTGWDAFYFDDLQISASSTETCDDGNTTGGDGCSALCTIEECGNAILDVGEECDDGNTTALDGCNATCDREFCGDGVVGSIFGLNEGFESGTPSGSTWTFGTPYGFEASTTHARTGRNALGPQNIGVASTTASVTLRDYVAGRLCFWWAGSSESCCDHFYFAIDGTNLLQREGTYTTWTEFCTDVAAGTHDMAWSYTKDGSINSGWDAFYIDDLDLPSARTEQCDDGNTTSGDGCSAACAIEECGNAIVDVGEQCDDGNTTALDGCSATCVREFCGDGLVGSVSGIAEQCDDGNTTSGDGCSAACMIEECGNGILDAGEQCDDGNLESTDACSASCHFSFCGDGHVNWSSPSDDFETGDLTRLPWTTGTTAATSWGVLRSPADAHGGREVLASRNGGVNNSLGWVEVPLTTSSGGQVCFWYSGESESCCDHLYFKVDGTTLLTSSGTVAWTEACYDVVAGTHTYRWEYSKDVSIHTGDDRFLIDDVRFPTIVETCDDGNTTAGDGCSPTCQTE